MLREEHPLPITTRVSQARKGPAQKASLKFAPLAACLVAVCLAQTAASLPASLNGAIGLNLGATGSQITWVDDGFLVPTAVLGLTFGVIGDLYGRKKTMLFGILSLAVGAAICLTAPTVQVLWVGEAVAGIGAAALFVSSLTIVTGLSSDNFSRARALGLWAVALTLGNVFNPLISGLTVAHVTWRWAYLPILCCAVLLTVLVILAVPDSRAPKGRSIDWPGQITMALGFFILLYGVIEASNRGWLVPSSLATFAVAIVLLAAFVVVELRSPRPMLRLQLFRLWPFSCAAVVALLAMAGYVGGIYDMSIRLSIIAGVSTPHMAVALSMLGLTGLIVGPVLRRVLQHASGRWPLGLGALAMVASLLWFAAIPLDDTSFLDIIPPFILFGIGLCFTVSALAAITVNSLPTELAGMASGAANQFRQFGQALGPAIIGSIALGRASTDLTTRLQQLPVSATERQAALAVNAHGGGLAVLSSNFGAATQQITGAADAALGGGYHLGLLVSAALIAAGAVIALINRRSDPARLQEAASRLVPVEPEEAGSDVA
jgi:MFS family permease